MADLNGPPAGGGGHGEGHRHKHHDHHGGKYAWSAEEAEHFLVHVCRGARRAYAPMVALVESHLQGAAGAPTVLDLGCGPGLMLLELRRALPRARLVGVDPSRDMLALARRVASESEASGGAPAFEVRQGSGEALPVEDTSVDVVTCRKVLHELDDVEATLREVARVLRPGGALVLQDFDGAYPRWRLRLLATAARVRGRDAAERVTRPFEDALALEEVVALCEGVGLRAARAERRGRHLTVVAKRSGDAS